MENVISFEELIKKDLPPVKYLLEPIIPEASLSFCFGSPGAFKTNFLLYVALKGADGQDVFDFKVHRPFRTLWVDEENREIGLKDKITKISNGITFKHPEAVKSNFVAISTGFRLLSPKSALWLIETIKEYKIDLVVIDSIAKTFPLSEKDEKDVRQIYNQLSIPIRNLGCSVMLIHHSRKKYQNQTSRGMEDMSGSREFSAMADSVIMIEKMGSNIYKLTQEKSRYSYISPSINFTINGTDTYISVIYKGEVSDIYTKREDKIVTEIKHWMLENNLKQFKRKKVLTEMKERGYKEHSIDNALSSMINDEYLFRDDFGYYNLTGGI